MNSRDDEANFSLLLNFLSACPIEVQFGFQVEDRSGSIKTLGVIIRQYGGRMVSLLTFCECVPAEYRKVYVRMIGINRAKLPELKNALKEKATLLYRVNHYENIREIA